MFDEFTPSQAEVALTSKIFEKADPGKLGILTGDVAVNVFSGSKLPAGVLGEVWAMADKENNGFLTRKGVAIALRLMGHAQRGERVAETLLKKPGMPPTIEGYTLPILQQNTGGSVNRARSPPAPALPPLTAQDKAKFMKIFVSCNPVNGMLSGEKAGEVFVKSKLTVEKLSQIWNLADTQNRGSLDSADFCVAMYLVQACMSGQLSFIPTTLPPGLYDQAAGKSFDNVIAHSTGGSSQISQGLTGSFNSRIPSGPIQPQYTGNQPLQPQATSPILRLAPNLPSRPSRSTNAFMQPQSTGQAPEWDVTPIEKANSDRFFDTLDTSKRGYVEGDIVVPFMLQSKLPEDVLAQVWDLADYNNDGRLTRDGFAIAMHLIQKKLAGVGIPATIPLSLMPPSMRGNHPPPVAPLPVQESIQDLLWDDTPPPSAITSPPQTLQPQRTGPIQPQAQILQPQRTGPLSSQPTGVQQPVSTSSPPPQRFPPANQDTFSSSQFTAARDLLEDDEEVASSPPLRDQSADIGNVQIQLGSTNRALETVKNERADIERTLAEQAAQLSTLQSQLTSAKTAYETETHLLETLRERYATQNTEINKSRQELITAESDLSAMRVEKNEVQGNLLRDKEEVRELQKKMALAGAEIDTLKVEIEKAKKDAKQQKGLLAIARKQLASRETEKFKVEKELQEAHTELVAATKEREDADAELVKEVPSNLTNGHSIEKPSSPDILSAAIAQPLPTTPDAIPSSPASIKGKSTNPFDRLTASGTPRSGSPFLPFATSDGSDPAVSAFAGASTDDPFGFSNPLPNVDEPEFPTVGTTSNGADDTTPSAPHVEPENFVVETRAAPTSATDNDDLFSTPPSSAVDRTSSSDRITGGLTGNSTTSYTGLDATAATQFPELSSPHPPGHFPEVHSAHETDINSVLKELEVDESDTSDEESDEAVAHKAATQAVSSDTFDAAPAKLSTFDDTFGFSSGPVAPALSSSAKNVESTPAIPSELQAPTDLALSTRTVLAPNGLASETAAGKNAFDEAMGTIPGGHAAPATDAPFSFDTAFDDNFDFAAAKAETEKPLFPPPKSSTTNGVIASTPTMGFDSAFGLQPASSVVSPSTAAPNKSLSFDDTFSTGASNVQSSSNPSTSGSDSHAITFDSAFVGRRLSKALAFDDAFSVPKDPPAQQTPFPVASPPTSPESAAPSGSIPSSPPATFRRSASPSPELVPRHPASKSRSSTGNSDKLKEPPPRHSRLSIRLPFGKKRKHDNPPPIPRSSTLSAPMEDTAPDDDVDTVKQLTAMGFSRDEAVAALERNSYDFQRALNSLLGSP